MDHYESPYVWLEMALAVKLFLSFYYKTRPIKNCLENIKMFLYLQQIPFSSKITIMILLPIQKA